MLIDTAQKKKKPSLMVVFPDKFKAELIKTFEKRLKCKVFCPLKMEDDIFSILVNEKPDYLLLDNSYPNFNGVEFFKRIEHIPVKIIIYSDTVSVDYLKFFLDSPATGFIQKDCSIEDFFLCLKNVFNGKRVILSNMNSFNIKQESISQNNKSTQMTESLLSKLTDREIDIWQLLSEGKREKQIAEILFISVNTVKSHKGNITKKLGIDKGNRISIVASSNKSVYTNT